MPKPSTKPIKARPNFRAYWGALVLALVTIALYFPALRYGFISFDDPEYAATNTYVRQGFTQEGIRQAFVTPIACNWHPLTMLSLMLDSQIFGPEAWGHHLVNVLLHALDTALVFLVLHKMTGAFWRSALVAALFGWHPAHVESVAWIAERKDVLSVFFWLLALWTYASFVEESKTGSKRSKTFFRWTLLLTALGLMGKAMLVTMPFVLLLLDHWPLERFKRHTLRELVIEKVPFFILIVAASIITFLVQQQSGSVSSIANFPLDARIGNAVMAYCLYLGKLFCPLDLAFYYPYPHSKYWPLGEVLLAGVGLCVISTLCLVARKRHPFFLMGWLWFLGTLVPVIGLVQVGEQSMADRYTYMPSLGILIMVVWGAYELSCSWRYQKIVWLAPASAALVVCILLTRSQLEYWKDSFTLFQRTVQLTESTQNNYVAHSLLGVEFFKRKQFEEAIAQLKEAVQQCPKFAKAYVNLGVVFLNQHQANEAVDALQEAVRLEPDNVDAHFNLGDALLKQGQADKAIGEFQETLRLKQDDPDAPRMLAEATALKEKLDALASDPGAMNNLAWVLATSPDDKVRNGARAVELAERACGQTQYQVPVMIGTLAAAYAEAGRFDEAVATAQKACVLAAQLGDTNLLMRNQELLGQYQAHKPYRESMATHSP